MHEPITPTLWLGLPPPGEDVRPVTTVDEAVATIEMGLVAVLPEGSYAEAQIVLSRVTDKKNATRRVAIAKRASRG